MPKKNVGLGVAMPAFAEVAGDAFPSNGYMLENKTYANAATHSNMGVYDGTVTATAEYENTLYQIAAGQYLPAGSEGDLETCPENSYCPGDVDVTYNETTDQGISSCPSGYPNSAAGASSNTQCYTACTVGMVEHASAVDGNDYYGTGTDTCAATECEGGYHVNEYVQIIEKTPLIDVDLTQDRIEQDYIDSNGDRYHSDNKYALSEPDTWAIELSEGVVYGRAFYVNAGNREIIEGILGDMFRGGMSPDWIRENKYDVMVSAFGKTKTDYFFDKVLQDFFEGKSDESMFDKELYALFGVVRDVDSLEFESCVCQMTGYKPTNGNMIQVTGPVVVPHFDHTGGISSCVHKCVAVNPPWGSAVLLGALDSIVAGTCAANEITINWTDATEADITANNAGMCTYGGDIRTPVKAAEKPGKRFKGWRFNVTE